MTLFNKIQKEIIKEYILRTDELFENIVRQKDFNKVEQKTWFNPNISNEHKKFLLEKYVLNDEVLIRIYVMKKLRGELRDFFLNERNYNMIGELTKLEQHLVNNYTTHRDEYDDSLTPQLLVVEAQRLWLEGTIWKLFENEAEPEFLITVRNNE